MNRNPCINIALIGLGYWGKNLLRNIVQSKYSGKIYVCDTDALLVQDAFARYRLSGSYTDADQIFETPEIEAVVIATPTSSHYELARKALLAGKHVLIEKPATTSTAQIAELISIAEGRKLTLMVDHIYLYNPAVLKLREFITDHKSIGKMHYIDSTRINLGIYQSDVNVLWDLACHDIAIINYLVDERPVSVKAIGRVNPLHGMEDVAYLFLQYDSGLLAHINASWASPVKIRKMILGGEKQMVIYDDIEPTNKLIVYDYEQISENDEGKNQLTDYRLGNVVMPKFELREALTNVVDGFYEAIRSGLPPLADGNNAAEVIHILECAQQSLHLGGETIAIR
ncbi:MAG: Gfo/Idh/MocA family oxidoreductase [Chitinophagales bacterium]|nr:Gfo/Idh/MocA family oxidoreductase [Chitinophagales bacterium]